MGGVQSAVSSGGTTAGEPSAGEEESGTAELDRDDVFHMLRNRRRRYALHCLKREEGSVDIGTLAERIAAWENEVDLDAVTSRQRKRAYNSLQQTHLPELADNGVVEYDPNRGTVTLAEHADRLDIYLEVVPDRDIPWSEYYLALGFVTTSMVVATWVGAYPFTLLPGLGWAVFVTTAFTVSAAINFFYQREAKLGTSEMPPELAGDGP